MQIGDRIRQARIAQGMSQLKLADALGVTKAAVALWEGHHRKPSREMSLKLAETLLCDPMWLMADQPSAGLFTANISAPDELVLLRTYRKMSPRAQKNILELMSVAADVTREIELQRQPA